MRVFDLPEIAAATEDFSDLRLIGKGSHGSVYRGFLADGSPVAVKKQSSGLQKLRDNSKLENEACILSSLSPESRHVVNLVGVGYGDAGDTILVVEFLPNGTLHDLLHSSASPPTWSNRLKFALQLAEATRHLHAPGAAVVHRDIKPANVLFDCNWNARLADFGLAAQMDAADVLPAGTIGYIDPNYTTPRRLSAAIDVYSYGVVLLELISCRKAIDLSKSPASLVEWALPLIRRRRTQQLLDARVRLPPHMEGTVELLLRTAALCLSPVESSRPSMSDIVAMLKDSPPPPRAFPLSRNYIREVVFRRRFDNGMKFNYANGSNLRAKNLVPFIISYFI